MNNARSSIAPRWISYGVRVYHDGALALLRDKTVSLMDSHRPEPLPDAVRQEINYISK
jgi:hypothetical protein